MFWVVLPRCERGSPSVSPWIPKDRSLFHPTIPNYSAAFRRILRGDVVACTRAGGIHLDWIHRGLTIGVGCVYGPSWPTIVRLLPHHLSRTVQGDFGSRFPRLLVAVPVSIHSLFKDTQKAKDSGRET